MGKILANDGIDAIGKKMLEEAGHTVLTENISQDVLAEFINKNNVDALLVRSATKVRKDLIDQCENLKFIGRGGVGMDNIDVEYARSKGKTVSNTPAASSISVAELVIAQMFAKARFVDMSNKQMIQPDASFKDLKNAYAKGIELKGKKIGIIGFGRIGQAVASYAIGLGMEVLAYDPFVKSAEINLQFFNHQKINFLIETVSLDHLIENADFITCHVPGGELLGAGQFAKMKKGVILINTARGGVINETALLEALDSGKVAGAALDVFNNEPNPDKSVITHPKISVTPHIGAATVEAQGRIAIEMAQILIDFFKK